MSEERRASAEKLRAALLQEVRDFLASEFEGPQPPRRPDPDWELQLAAAVLMICLLRADRESRQDEHRALERGLRRVFRLGEDASARLLRRAEETLAMGVGLADVVQVVDEASSLEQRKRIVETLWRVAYADAELQGHEEYLVRKIADLLQLTTADLIETKVRAREAFLKEDL